MSDLARAQHELAVEQARNRHLEAEIRTLHHWIISLIESGEAQVGCHEYGPIIERYQEIALAAARGVLPDE